MRNILHVGMDISGRYNDVCAINPLGEVVVPHRRFAYDMGGFEALVTWLLEVARAGEFDAVQVGAEATGLLWFHIMWQLRQDEELAAIDFATFLYNARDVKKGKQAFGEPDKTDRKGAHGIAELLRVRHISTHPLDLDARYLALQRLTRYRYHLAHVLAGEKTYARLVPLHLKMNTYRSGAPFSHPFAQSGLWALTNYLTVDDLVRADHDELATALAAVSRGRLGDPHDSAAQLQALAAEALPLPEAMVEPVNILLETMLAHIEALQQIMADLSKSIETLAQDLPGYAHLRSIPGIGPVYAAGLLAEVQEVNRFMTDPKGRPRRQHDGQAALARFAGLWWPRKESGDFKGEDRRLAKTGNRYLRYYFIEAANTVRRFEPEYRAFYARKYAGANRHHHRRAVTLTARKLVRLVFSLLLNDRDYQPRGGRADA
jgi:transposase